MSKFVTFLLFLILFQFGVSDVLKLVPYSVPIGVYPFSLRVEGEYFQRRHSRCKFESGGKLEETQGIYVNSSLIYCPIPKTEVEMDYNFYVDQVWTEFEIFTPPNVWNMYPTLASMDSRMLIQLGIRNESYRPTMRGRFGDIEVPIMYNHEDEIYCHLPVVSKPDRVPFLLSMNGLHFNSTLWFFTYFIQPRVESITPLYTHTRGGDEISIVGGPFIQTEQLVCKWGDFGITKGLYLSINEIKCVAPPTQGVNQTIQLEVSQNSIEWVYSGLNFTFAEVCFCNGRGSCRDSKVCRCSAGWSGISCEVCAHQCNYGKCNSKGDCDCIVGFSGKNCEAPNILWYFILPLLGGVSLLFIVIILILGVKNIRKQMGSQNHFSSL